MDHSRRTLSASSSSSFSSSSSSSSSSFQQNEEEGNDVIRAMEMLSIADAVCFDVDSTVVDEEGIDVLAETLGKGPEVSAWTTRAMGGDVKFEDALRARLDIIRPSRDDVSSCLANHPLRLTSGISELISALHDRGTHVYLVSGGFRLMIDPVATTLGVSRDRVYANTILFDEFGEYAGFDVDEPTSADGGKPKALSIIKERHGYNTMIMVGDGATDAQARPPADAFIGYGGVITRDAVREKACWFVRDFARMIEIVGGNKTR
jgi:phosphoserine phosphatase